MELQYPMKSLMPPIGSLKNDENTKKDINGDVNKETGKKNEIHKMIYSTLVTLSKIIEVAKPDKV